MAGHRRGTGRKITLAARYERRRTQVRRQVSEADSPMKRVLAAFDHLRAAIASTDRMHREAADDIADRAAIALQLLGDELYETAIRERRASR